MEADLYWVFSNIMDRGQKDLFNQVVNRVQKTRKDELFSWNIESNELVGKDKS
jgi:hypothetical protein